MSPFTHELDAIYNDSFTFHKADLCKPGAAEDAISACIAKHGPNIDVLANVAGIMDAFSSADTVRDSEWERVLTVNLTVPVRMMTAVLPSMKNRQSGSIVNVGSYASLSGAVAGIAYTASKHGLVGATKNVAPVQVLCQGLKRDDLPYGSVGPDDIAQGIAFLASDAAKTISGVVMPIDNAWSTI
ncbi:unnamed protein product [Alternaria alternata]